MDPATIALAIQGLVTLTQVVTKLVQDSNLPPAEKEAYLAQIKAAQAAVPTEPV